MKKIKVIISGGGTGGHIFPAVSIAKSLESIYPNIELLFVGAEGRMEMTRVPQEGYKIIGLPIQGLIRSLSLKNIKVLRNAVKSVFLAKKIIKDFEPDVVIGVGGYASGPVLWSASSLGIPTLIQEQNSYAGLTNKILAKKSKRVCVAYEGMERFFPKDRIILTGNPIRPQLLNIEVDKAAAYKHFGLSAKKKTLLVVGGSLGARTINEAILKDLSKFASQEKEIQLIWQTGKYYFKKIETSTKSTKSSNVIVTDFVSRMDLAYQIADLVVSRAGASSISELSALGKACVLVPSPNVSEDHQTKNAEALSTKGAAVLITDEAAKQDFNEQIIALLKADEKLSSLKENILKLAKTNAAEDIATEVLALIGLKPQKKKKPKLKLKKLKPKNENKYFFLGIGGIGMSALARFYKNEGAEVGGYDLTPSKLTQTLEEEGIEIHYKDNVSLIPVKYMNPTLTEIIQTAAIPDDNKELNFFKAGGFKVIKRSIALKELTAKKKAICVAGTHGKTTVSTIVAHLFKQSKIGTNAFLGGISNNYQSNLLVDKESPFVVIEADEYDRSFHQLSPQSAIITNTDADHLDIYGSKEELLKAFSEFTALIQDGGFLVKRKGIDLVADTKDSVSVFEYAINEKADFYGENIRIEDEKLRFDFRSIKGDIKDLELGVPIPINVENAVAAIAIGLLNGIEIEEIPAAINSFSGIKRRFDLKYQDEKIRFIDDYAHHPVELEASISSVKELYPGKKICAIFQPHLFSRTKDFAADFGKSLSKLDSLILLDIYPARELPIKGVDAGLIYKYVDCKEKTLCKKGAIISKLEKTSFDILLTLGAGDINKEIPKIVAYLKNKQK